MSWKDTIKKQGAETWNCGCAVDYEGMPPDHDLEHYPCKKYEKDEVCDFAIAMYKKSPKLSEAVLTRRGKTEKLAKLKELHRN